MNEQKSSRGLVVALVIAFVIILGLAIYICYDKGIIFSKSSTTTESSNTTKEETTEEEEVKEEEESTKTPNTRECVGTYSGVVSIASATGEASDQTYTYTLNKDKTYHEVYSYGMYEDGIYEIIDNTIVFISMKHTAGSREEDPYYTSYQAVMADDCSLMRLTVNNNIFILNKQ